MGGDDYLDEVDSPWNLRGSTDATAAKLLYHSSVIGGERGKGGLWDKRVRDLISSNTAARLIKSVAHSDLVLDLTIQEHGAHERAKRRRCTSRGPLVRLLDATPGRIGPAVVDARF